MSIDPGLQPQRTALAWQRTGLSVLLACAAAGFAALRHGFPAAALCTFVAGVVLCHVAVRHFPKGPDRVAGTGSVWPTMVATVGVVVVIALAGTALAIADMVFG
ncbi:MULTISPECIES: DUF202 domain-containing protein [Gordonia]|uniref:DUF202 domain-containing protein n=2 Tax=Gordonia TaxID=2053 RepID=L7LMH1_9ACTN|nr:MULTISPECIES: DUF202 domain-containing protein [Gordonia]AUH69342.1 DUF202 domain-containing protein [Gordonia sp. YC-JH1]KJR09800.1 hypothetical protein UG54_03395 [Gordonia sihwensis]MBY4571725.1 hypothetical protein [Gordonia sihwensis]WFN94345.1 DUF202 domain-containing protein [Gordonia sihwensis]GAC61238.1 hypothetical protein GSI01S_15_01080 [Gordonia sihwensis NBRC 108236]